MEEILQIPEIVRGFEKAIAGIFVKLVNMEEKQDCILTKLDEIEEKTRKNTHVFMDQEKALKACHTAFIQVRDACHCLREELSEAAGTMVMESWNM